MRAIIGMACHPVTGPVRFDDKKEAEKKDEKDKKEDENTVMVRLVAAHLADGLKMRNAISHNSNPLAWIFRY